MIRIARVSFVLSALAVVFSACPVQAQSPVCGWGGYGFNFGYDWRANAQVIPYFAQHPPVYYSYPIARPYGFTPYAVPPGVIPAEMQIAPQAQEIINPYFKPKAEEAPAPSDPPATVDPPATTTGDRTARRMIVNPYLAVSR
jgi:hypothetical protein